MEDLKPWEINPDEYLKDEEGNFILTKAGIPRKRAGKKQGSPHNFHSKTKARMVVRKKVREYEKKVDRDEKKLLDKKRYLKKRKELLSKVDAAEGRVKKPTIMDEVDISKLPKSLRDEIQNGDKVSFRPNPGPQTDFLAAPELDVLYGGAAGGGKSYAMIVDPLRSVMFKEHNALILRCTLGELRELIDKSRELYPLAYPGAKFKESEKVWTFPSGAKIQYGFLERDSDVYQYQGRAYSWIGFDEITHLPTEFAWNYLGSRLRTTNPQLDVYMRCTANPGGIGHSWVKKRYIDPAEPNTTFVASGLSRKFIPAKLQDNPYLAADGRYQLMLESLPEVERRRLLGGDWNIVDGIAFPEFNLNEHVIHPMEIPPYWERIKSVDYGYSAPACCLWGAVDPQSGTLIIYKELYERGLEPPELARRMKDLEDEDAMLKLFHRSISGVIDWAVFARTGHTGPTIGETLLRAGHKLRAADKNRKGGKIQIHEWLRPDDKGRPRLQIFSTCPNLIRELQALPLKENDPEDVDTHADDHAYDALRYMVMSRPRRETMRDRMNRYKQDIYIPADPRIGY